MNLLLLSNSTNSGSGFLTHARSWIKGFLQETGVYEASGYVVFIPYASVIESYEEYENRLGDALAPDILSWDTQPYIPLREKITNAKVILVGGGNTFRLLEKLYDYDLMDLIREKVIEGTPYIGWSAGANIASPTIATTNDMPIVFPCTNKALGIIDFQINPHYTESSLENHQGESRDHRINEYLNENKLATVIGLREGTGIKVRGDESEHLGDLPARIFRYNQIPIDEKLSTIMA